MIQSAICFFLKHIFETYLGNVFYDNIF